MNNWKAIELNECERRRSLDFFYSMNAEDNALHH